MRRLVSTAVGLSTCTIVVKETKSSSSCRVVFESTAVPWQYGGYHRLTSTHRPWGNKKKRSGKLMQKYVSILATVLTTRFMKEPAIKLFGNGSNYKIIKEQFFSLLAEAAHGAVECARVFVRQYKHNEPVKRVS
jgi:hypothetical protein